MSEQLKPCPCCGSDAQISRVTSSWWSADCSSEQCNLGNARDSKQGAIDAWNRRAIPVELLRKVLAHIERNTCTHEETHRGGAIWEICDSCGAKWADDEGGKPEFKWPDYVEELRALLGKD